MIMRINEYILTENKIEYIAQYMGDAIEDRLRADTSGVATQLVNKGASALEVVEFMSKYDPTPNNKYLQWIVNAYVKGKGKLEDGGRIRRALTLFVQNMDRLNQKDIYQYNTLPDLEQALEDVMGDSDVPVLSKRQEKKAVKREGAEIVAKLADGDVYHIKTQEAACYYGKGTRWCTTSTDTFDVGDEKERTAFEYYNAAGALFIFIPNDGNMNNRIQMHFGGEVSIENDDLYDDVVEPQVMDVKDDPVSIKDIADRYPSLLDFIGKHGGASLFINALDYPNTMDAMTVRDIVDLGLEKYIIRNLDALRSYLRHILSKMTTFTTVRRISMYKQGYQYQQIWNLGGVTDEVYEWVVGLEDVISSSYLASILLIRGRSVPAELELDVGWGLDDEDDSAFNYIFTLLKQGHYDLTPLILSEIKDLDIERFSEVTSKIMARALGMSINNSNVEFSPSIIDMLEQRLQDPDVLAYYLKHMKFALSHSFSTNKDIITHEVDTVEELIDGLKQLKAQVQK
jgi:hypothetical protein